MKFGKLAQTGPIQGQIVKISNFSTKKNKMAAAAILKNHKKSRYHSNGLTDLREIWHDYAKWVS